MGSRSQRPQLVHWSTTFQPRDLKAWLSVLKPGYVHHGKTTSGNGEDGRLETRTYEVHIGGVGPI